MGDPGGRRTDPLLPWLLIFCQVALAVIALTSSLPNDPGPVTIVASLYILGLLCLLFGVLAIYSILAAGRARGWAALGMILGGQRSGAVGRHLDDLGDCRLRPQRRLQIRAHGRTKEAYNLMSGGSWSARVIPIFVVGGVAGVVASISLGVALWRSGQFAKWIGPVFGVAFLLSVVSAPIVTLVGAILLIVTGIMIAREGGSANLHTGARGRYGGRIALSGQPKPASRSRGRLALQRPLRLGAGCRTWPLLQHPVQQVGAGRCLRMTPIRIQRRG